MKREQTVARANSDKANLTLRLPEPLRATLEDAAKQEGRSLNTEIVQRLTASLAPRKLAEEVFGDDAIFLTTLASILQDARGNPDLKAMLDRTAVGELQREVDKQRRAMIVDLILGKSPAEKA